MHAGFALLVLLATTQAEAPTTQPTTAASPAASAPARMHPQTGPVCGPWLTETLVLAPLEAPSVIAPSPSLADRERELEAAVVGADSANARIRALVNLATWRVCTQAEPLLTRMMLGFGDETDAHRVERIAMQAQDDLAAAEALLAEGEVVDVAMRVRVDLLAVWPTLLRAAAVGDAPTCATIAEQLTPLAGSPIEPIGQIGRFWTAWLYRRAERTVDAIGMLEPALADWGRHPYGVLPRLLRCQLLADQGYVTAASALLLRLADQADADSQAGAAVVLARLQLIDAICDQLGATGRLDEATQQRRLGRQVRDAAFPPDHTTALPRLGPLIPGVLLLAPPASQPVTQPTTTQSTTRPAD